MSKFSYKLSVIDKDGKSSHTNTTGRVGVEHATKLGTVVITDLRIIPRSVSLLSELSASKNLTVESVSPAHLSCDVYNKMGESENVTDSRFVIEFTDAGVKIYS